MTKKERQGISTIKTILHQAVVQLRDATDSPNLEAEILLAYVLNRPRSYLFAHSEASLAPEDVLRYLSLVQRRCEGEPLPYITGQIAFFGLTMTVTPDVLIPRPETERLIEEALAWLQNHLVRTAVDVGTGSGCIAVALAVHAPQLQLYATDISPAALRVAHRNAVRHDVASRIDFLEGNLLTPLSALASIRDLTNTSVPVDMVLSNPPYIAEGEWDHLPPSVQREPRAALMAGLQGLDIIHRLLQQVRTYLRPQGLLLMEIGEQQGEAVHAMVQRLLPNSKQEILPDLAGKDRVLKLVKGNF
jgi:release factor glutamine methyltransferase